MLSSFQIKEYRIVKLGVDMTVLTEPTDVELQYFAQYNSRYSDGSWGGEMLLAFRRVPSNNEDTVISEVVISGKFIMTGENTDEVKEQFVKRLKINGTSTLIPIARAALSSTFAIMCYPNNFNIPNINVMDMKWKDLDSTENE